jgi:hypothetical protein
VNAKKQLEVRVILPAKASEIFVGFRIKSANRFQVANRRGEIYVAGCSCTILREKSKGAVDREQIINKRNGGYAEETIIEGRRNYCTPRGSIRSISTVIKDTCSTHP